MPGFFDAAVEAVFCAAHALRENKREIEPLHGHNFHVTVTVTGQKLDEIGALIDFRDLQRLLDAELKRLNNRNLNTDVDEFALAGEALSPSAENIAFVLFRRLRPGLPARVQLASVRVSEAPGTRAAYRE